MTEPARGVPDPERAWDAGDPQGGEPEKPEAVAWAYSVRARRVELGMTQLQLAHRAGLTQQAVSYIERGVGVPRVTTMVRLARALGTTVEDLVPASWPPDPDHLPADR